VVRKEMIIVQLHDFALICSGFLEHFWTGSGHGSKGRNNKWRFTESQEMEAMCARREMVVEVKGGLGFDLTLLFITAWVIWAVTVHYASHLITGCTKGPQQLSQLF
jgi:hypothetical protein